MKRPAYGDTFFYRLGWFIQLRWLASLGLLPGLFCFSHLFDLEVNWVPFVVVNSLMFAVNIAYNCYYHLQNHFDKEYTKAIPRPALLFAHIQVLVDLLLLTALIYLLGTFYYPFYLFYIFHIIISSLLLKKRDVILYSTFSLILFTLSAVVEFYFSCTAFAITAFPEQAHISYLHRFLSVFLPLFAVFYLTTYMTTSIAESLKKRQQEIEALSEELEQKNITLELHNNARERFMSVAFHELKAPLAAVDGYLQILINNIGDASEQEKKRMLSRMYARIRQLITFLKHLRDYSELELNDQDDAPKLVDMHDVAMEAIKINQPDAKKKNVFFDHAIPQKLPHVLGERSRILQVLNNILSNAIKYTDAGSIRFKASITEKGEILFRVTDTGRGISEQDLPDIFEDFFTTKDIKKRRTAGAGLGLSISKKIIARMNGKIWAESELDKGSVFYVVIPGIALQTPTNDSGVK